MTGATLHLRPAKGIDHAYRVPLVLLQRFRDNLDRRNPALIDASLAS